MGYKSTPSSGAVRACGHDFYFSKITFILHQFQQGKTLAPRLKRRYAAWIGFLNQMEQADRIAFLSFILRAAKDCPAVLLSIDIWPELIAAWTLFRQNEQGETVLLTELGLYDLLFPRAEQTYWRRHLRVLAGLEQEDHIRFFADILAEQSLHGTATGEAWKEAALHLLTGGRLHRSREDRAVAMLEMERFFTLTHGKSRVFGVILYQGCRISISKLKENTPVEHWFFSSLMALFAESPYAERLCAKLERPVSALVAQTWWYPYFQLWMSSEFPVFARLLLPRQAQGLFRPFGQIPGDIVIRNLPLFMLKKLPELLRDNREKKLIVHLASGNSIRTARNLPFPLTKKVAHCFTNLPDAADYREAFWLAFGQACGASARVVQHFRRFWRFTEIKEHYTFLESALRFAEQAGYADARLDAVAGYWRHAVHESLGQYSLQGRTPESVQRQAEAFYEQVQFGFQGRKPLFWRAHGQVKPFLHQTENGCYTITELTSSVDLFEEGQTMRHCVGSYAWECFQGQSSIWSLRSLNGASKNVLVTIQLDARNRIVQAKGHCNRLPTVSEMALIRRWAEEQGLTVYRF